MSLKMFIQNSFKSEKKKFVVLEYKAIQFLEHI